MTVEEAERIVDYFNFRPYRLVLESGEEIRVTRPRKSHVSGDTINLVGDSLLPTGELRKDKFRIVPVSKVVTAEFLQPANDDDWKAKIMQAAGMWKDRDDLPDVEEIRKSLDRNPWSREL